MNSSSRQTLGDSLFYPFGNTCARNLLKDMDDAGSAGSKTINILFLGCGDLRNMWKSLEVKSHSKLHVHLNDNSPSVLARNILMLKVISAESFDSQDKEQMSFLWDLWYNMDWPETTREKFVAILKEVVFSKVILPDNLSIPNKDSLQNLRQVWSAWYSFSSNNQLQSELLLKKVNKERSLYILKSLNKESSGDMLEDHMLEEAFSRAANGKAVQWELNIGFENLDDMMRKKIYDEARQYFQNGSCRLRTETASMFANPTLLDPITHRWQVDSPCPFDSYLPLPKEELITSANEEILIQSCQKILKRFVEAYRRHMKTVKISIHLGTALEFCCTRAAEKFDVIDCSSSILDDIGLANLIVACSDRLSDNPNAVLFTETINWIEVAPSVLQYVENSLCAPLSMIPTLYGWHLLDYVELGDSSPNIMRHPVWHSVNLSWKKAPIYQNAVLISSPALNRFLDQFAQKCFVETKYFNGESSKENCRIEKWLTPLTFSYIINSLIHRVRGDSWLKEAPKLEIPSVFTLAKRTADAWRDGQVISKLSFDIRFTDAVEAAFKNLTAKSEKPILCLVLVSNEEVKKYFKQPLGEEEIAKDFLESLSASDVHFVDNFQLVLNKTSLLEEKLIRSPFHFCWYKTTAWKRPTVPSSSIL